MIKKVLAGCMGAALAVTLIGCAGANNVTTTEETSVEANGTETQYAIVGQQVEGNIEILMTNDMGQAISSLTLKAGNEQTFTDNFLQPSMTLASGEQFLFCFMPTGADVAYEMGITLADGTQYTLTDLRLSDYQSMDLIVKDDKASVTYTTRSDETGSTPSVAKTDAGR